MEFIIFGEQVKCLLKYINNFWFYKIFLFKLSLIDLLHTEKQNREVVFDGYKVIRTLGKALKLSKL